MVKLEKYTTLQIGALPTTSGRVVYDTDLNVVKYINGTESRELVNKDGSGNLSGTLTTAAQPNITSLGTLTSLNITNTASLINLTSSSASNLSSINYITNGHDWECGARGSALDAPNSFYIYSNTSSAYRLVISPTTGNVGINTSLPDKQMEINSSTGDCLRLTYNDSDGSATNYTDLSVSSTGDLTITPSGGDTNIIGTLNVSGNKTLASWLTTGIQYASTSATYTNSSVAGTYASAVITSYARPTIAASNAATTTTNAATVYIENSPLNGTNMTITNSYALWIPNGNVLFGGTLSGITTLTATTLAGTLSTAAQPNITSIGTLSTLDISNAGGTSLSITSTTASSTTHIKYITNGDDWEFGSGGSTNSTPNSMYWYNASIRMVLTNTSRLGINTIAPDKQLEVNSATGDCLRLTYNDNNGSAVNYVDFAVSSSGDLTITPSGGDINIIGDIAISGNKTTASWLTTGIQYSSSSATFTNNSTAASGTAASAVITSYARPTIAATNATVTTTNAATVYIENSPLNGTNMTLTNSYALWVAAGNTLLGGNLGINLGAQTIAGTIDLGANAADRSILLFHSGTEIYGFGANTSVIKYQAGASAGHAWYNNATTSSSGTELMRILSGGNVGIGTSAPDKKLEINSSTGDCLRLTYNDSNGSSANYVDFNVSSSGDLTITPSGGDINIIGNINISGNKTTASWLTTGIQYSSSSATFTNNSTAASGTAASAVITSYARPTIAATNATVTTTNAATVYIENSPLNGTNMTLTNSYALWVAAGNTLLGGALTTSGDIKSTGGDIVIDDGFEFILARDVATKDTNCSIYSDGVSSLVLASSRGNGVIKMITNETAGNTFTLNNSIATNNITVNGINNRVGIFTNSPDKQLEINSSTGDCLRLTYNDSNGSSANYVDFAVSSSGDLTITPSGGDINIIGDINISGNKTTASWLTTGIQYSSSSATFTNNSTAASGTAASAVITSYARPTIAATNATVTTTTAATVYIENSPLNGTNMTLTNSYALWVAAGNILIGGTTTTVQMPLMVKTASSSNGFCQTDGTVVLNTYIGASHAFLQTYTNHPLSFAINNGFAAVTLAITNNLGIGTTAPDKRLEINSATGDCLRLTYNDSNGSATNYVDLTVSSGGNLTLTPSGTVINITGNMNITKVGQVVKFSDGTIDLAVYINNAGFPGFAYFGPTTNHGLNIQTNNIVRMYIENTGDVFVNNSLKTARLLIGTSTDTARMISALNSAMVDNSTIFFTLGKANSGNNQAEMYYKHVTDGSATLNHGGLGMFGSAEALTWNGTKCVGIGKTPATTTSSTSTTTGALTVQGGAGIAGDIYATGLGLTNTFISFNGKISVETLLTNIDMTTGYSNSNYYPVALRRSIHGSYYGDPVISFSIGGDSLGGGDSYNENSCVGVARGGGYSDHSSFVDVFIRKFIHTEDRILGIYRGTQEFEDGIVIYLRGGYGYTIATDASTVTVGTSGSALTIGTSVFAIKNSSGVDVTGTTTSASEIKNLTGFSGRHISEDLMCEGIGIRISEPAADLHIKQSSDGNSGGFRIEENGEVNYWSMFVNSNNNLDWQNNGTGKGYFATAGTNVQMNFTGQHRSFSNNTNIINNINDYIGLIVSTTGNHKNINDDVLTVNDALPMVDLSTINNDKKVFGVISNKEDENTRTYEIGMFGTIYTINEGDERLFINSVGEGMVWVCNKNGNIDNGDYITTSTVVGYGVLQSDDILHNYTVAKSTKNCTFSIPERYVDLTGNVITQATYNNDTNNGYKCNLIPCTYHSA